MDALLLRPSNLLPFLLDLLNSPPRPPPTL
jgi:hypothetical protein